VWASGIGYSYREAERIRMDPAVVLGQHLSDVTGPVRESMVAGQAADGCDMGYGHGKSAEFGLIIISIMQPTAANDLSRVESSATPIRMAELN